MMITHRLKFLFAMLTGFALGVALGAAWFLARQPPVNQPAPGAERATGDTERHEIPPTTYSPSVPWRIPEVRKAGGTVASESDRTGDTEVSDKQILAVRNHEARTRSLRMSSWLGLDSLQASSLEAMLLEEGADGILEIPSALEPWIKSNLRPDQVDAYARYQQSTQKDEAEASALKEVHELAQVVELSEEQRDAIFQNKFEFYQMWAGFDSLVFTGPIINHRADPVVITESRIEMPVFSTRRISDGLLTEEQAHAFGEFKRKERELEELKAREQE